MAVKKNILAIVGSPSPHSSNLRLVECIGKLAEAELIVTIYNDLKLLPHFDPELSTSNPPASIVAVRDAIQRSDGLLICTPEYVFSIPSGLKNIIEWCISTTVFSDKPTGLITASANGEKGHEELQLIMKTAMAKFTKDTTLLISGIKGKIDSHGNISNPETLQTLHQFVVSFVDLVNEKA